MSHRNFAVSAAIAFALLCGICLAADGGKKSQHANAAQGKTRRTASQSGCDCDKKARATKQRGAKYGYNPCVCDKYPLYDLGGGQWLFFADQYDSCEDCLSPLDCYDVEVEPFHYDECPHCGAYDSSVPDGPQLKQKRQYPYTTQQFTTDLYQLHDVPDDHLPAQLLNVSLNYKVEGDPKLIGFVLNGSSVYAEVFLVSLWPPANHELIVQGLGVEISTPPQNEQINWASRVSTHKDPRTGSLWKHAYDVQIGGIRYLVVTER